MAKKAKRRGRPPGSKNKNAIGRSVAKMDVPQLRAHIADLEKLLAKMVSKQQAYFQDQLARLGSYVSKTASGVAATISPRSGKRAKARPKYQSKKKPSLKWSGRGMTPVWLREEMKETRLGKEDFLIRS